MGAENSRPFCALLVRSFAHLCLCVVRRLETTGPLVWPASPRRLPLQTARYRIGILGVVALVALRLGIGWHFFQEGAAKVQDGKFSSVGFLSAAKGPLAPAYHDLVWDADGFFRLQEEDTVKAWEAHAAEVAEHFEFDTQQRAEAEAIVERYKGQLKTFFDVNEDDLYEYEEGLRRREEYRGWAEDLTPEERNANRAWTEVPSLRGQLTSHEA
jgi:hypothetical protein